jgi:thiol-disulfide isomerase/thioredoxin
LRASGVAAIVALGLICLSPLDRVRAQGTPQADPRIADATDRGEAALKTRKWEEALNAFKEAHAASNKSSPLALFGMARAYHELGAYKNEAESCADALKLLGGSNPLFEAVLRNQRGLALFGLAEKPTDKVLKEAEAEFRTALELPGAAPITRFNLGVTLLRQSRDEEGIALLQSYVDAVPKAPETDRARRMIDNPRRARENFATDYSLTTRAGEFLSSKDLVGKTVFLDFWGTWCGPCLAATPDLVRLYRKLEANGFVMIGISSDAASAKQTWMNYIDENKMTWPQTLDSSRNVIRAFNVGTYPTYIVINHEGIITMRLEGYGRTTIQQAESEIRKQMKANR